MNQEIKKYNDTLVSPDKEICELLSKIIDENLPNATNKIWHGHPVWFLDENPIVGYAKLKASVQLLFWSGQEFDEEGLTAEGSFKAAETRYTEISQVNIEDLKRWLKKAVEIQYNYRDIVKNKGKLDRIS